MTPQRTNTFIKILRTPFKLLLYRQSYLTFIKNSPITIVLLHPIILSQLIENIIPLRSTTLSTRIIIFLVIPAVPPICVRGYRLHYKMIQYLYRFNVISILLLIPYHRVIQLSRFIFLYIRIPMLYHQVSYSQNIII